MGQNAGQLLFTIHGRQQSAINKNIAGRNGKRIIRIYIDNVKSIVEQGVFQTLNDAIADLVNVIDNCRIINNLILLINVAQDLPGELLFFTDGNAKGTLGL
jgi:hypothetical protein